MITVSQVDTLRPTCSGVHTGCAPGASRNTRGGARLEQLEARLRRVPGPALTAAAIRAECLGQRCVRAAVDQSARLAIALDRERPDHAILARLDQFQADLLVELADHATIIAAAKAEPSSVTVTVYLRRSGPWNSAVVVSP